MRCHALTKGWTRCRRDAEVGKLFCYSHRGWLLGAFITAVVTIVGLCAGLSQIFNAQLPNPLATRTPLPTFTETRTPTFIPTFLTETPTFTLTYTSTSTTIWTSTPIPSQTLTPIQTLTVTPLALENYGGLVFDCIPDRYWDLIATTDIHSVNGCFPLRDWGLYSDYRKLKIILPSQKVRNNLVKDIFLPISGNADISFSVTIEQFKGSGETHASPLFSIGMCNQQDSKYKNNAILYSAREDGTILWGIINDGYESFEKNYTYKLFTQQEFIIQIRSYDLTIIQKEGNSTKFLWNKTVSPEDLSAFCIHYTLPTLGELTATIDNFLVEKK